MIIKTEEVAEGSNVERVRGQTQVRKVNGFYSWQYCPLLSLQGLFCDTWPNFRVGNKKESKLSILEQYVFSLKEALS